MDHNEFIAGVARENGRLVKTYVGKEISATNKMLTEYVSRLVRLSVSQLTHDIEALQERNIRQGGMIAQLAHEVGQLKSQLRAKR